MRKARKTKEAAAPNEQRTVANKTKKVTRKNTVRVPKKKKGAEVSDDAIRLRAYFLSQERRRHGMSSDPNSDWIEARRQLLGEVA